MGRIDELARGFLSQRRIAVAGVSRDPKQAANLIYRKLRDADYEVYPVNPRAASVEDTTCYPTLDALPAPVDACVIATPTAAVPELVEQCAAGNVKWVWMHRSFGEGSVSDAAVEKCREHGINVIAGGCPMMFCEPVDFGHKCMRWILKTTGKLP